MQRKTHHFEKCCGNATFDASHVDKFRCFTERWAAEQKCVGYHGYDCLRVQALAVEVGKESEVDKENKPQR